MSADEAQSLDEIILRRRRPFTVAELIADGIVHGVGLLVALIAGTVLITLAILHAAGQEIAAIGIYVASMVVLLSASMAFNLCPTGPLKAWLARVDQAAIFLFIAASYTPLLVALGDVPIAEKLMIFVWSTALIGVALKLLVPQHFGRLAIPFYLAIGWSGILAFHALAAALPPTAVWLIVAGGVAYSAGIIFHLWEKLHFHNVLWHTFVIVGATLHLIAIFDAMVISRM
ncbi:PAQR family membrane homeostasis protein TrhA [Pelagibacterium luteolum]|uniref:Hemolysin III n=1 Tax=Pelagibacterium luteolum TaxID=440168 RepID=A0A1G7TSM2_9HYPH|nr:hemolysin III family protein [Pelagibacterium luteolum]SDG37669.1 hemolysin III [Pelagibacterium luteolum]